MGAMEMLYILVLVAAYTVYTTVNLTEPKAVSLLYVNYTSMLENA